MPAITHRNLRTNCIDMHTAEAGSSGQTLGGIVLWLPRVLALVAASASRTGSDGLPYRRAR